MFNNKKSSQTKIETLISSRTSFEGNITFQGGIRIDGHFHGNVDGAEDECSLVIISESGEVQGSVTATHIINNGTIHGPVRATEVLELQPNAKVYGDVFYKVLEMHNGAVVDGTLKHEISKPDLKLLASGTI